MEGAFCDLQKSTKKVQKTCKKVLTKERRCDIISKLSEREASERKKSKKLKKLSKNLLTNESGCDIIYRLR